MRCKNCGWNNPDTAKECEKCHSKFKNIPNGKGPNPFRPGSSKDLGKSPTVMGAVGDLKIEAPKSPRPVVIPPVSNPFGTPSSGDSTNCTSCGYPLSKGVTSCPNCGSPVVSTPEPSSATESANEQPAFQGTVLSGRNPFFGNPMGGVALTPVDGGTPVNIPDSASVDLGIAGGKLMTDAGDQVARLTCDRGNWSIESLDENTPVYIRVSGGKFTLVEGDIIVIDGKQYRLSL